MENWVKDVAIITLWILALLVHELGHAYYAKKNRIFKRWMFTGFVIGVEMTDILPKRGQYLAGLWWSFLTYPLVLFFVNVGLFESSIIWVWPIILVGMAALDILVWFDYGNIVRYRKFIKFQVLRDSMWNRLWTKAFAVDYEDSGIIWVYRK